jgi:flagellar FliJ protein
MTHPFSLQPLVHLSQQKNDAATKKLGLLNHNLQTVQSKMEMLQQYRRDYQEKMLQAEQSGMALQDLRNFQDFIYRLDDAIAQQNIAVTHAQNQLIKGRSELTEAQRRMKSFDTLAHRHAESEKKLDAKIEQRIQDEHSGRSMAYRNAEHNAED